MATTCAPCTDKRTGPRLEVEGLVYVNTPYESTFMLNLGARGMQVQAMEVLAPGASIPFAFPLPETDTEVKGMARVVWTDSSGRAGLEFTDVPQTLSFRLKQWVIKHAN